MLNPEKQFEINAQMDKDLINLVKTSQTLEAERGKSGSSKIAKGARLLKLLRKEYFNVMIDLCNSKCGMRRLEDSKIFKQLTVLVKNYGRLSKTMKEKDAFLKEIEHTIKQHKTKIEEITARVPSNVLLMERLRLGEKTLQGLENKLESYVKQYGVISTESRSLREEINHILIDRMSFNKLWYFYISNLSQGKQILMDILEQATLSYNARDEYVIKLQALRSFAMNNLVMDTQEMEMLQKHLDNDLKLEEFVSFKQQFRNLKQLFDKKNEKRIEQRTRAQQLLEHQQNLLKKIQSFSRTDCRQSTVGFANKFRTREIENMALFNYINELCFHIEDANNEFIHVQIAIDQQRMLSHRRERQQKQNLAVLKKQLMQKVDEGNSKEEKLNDINSALDQIYLGVTKLFKVCKCSKAPFLQLLGSNTTINDFNVLLYLKVLEESISNYLKLVYYIEVTTKKGKPTKPGELIINDELKPLQKQAIEDFCPTHPCPLCVDREMVSDVIDTLQQVQPREEVKTKLEIRLMLENGANRLHNVSACNLPKSREIMQRRYQ